MSDIKQVCAALVQAQKSFGPALKDKTNPHFRSKYADLGACIDAVIDALNGAGIALVQKQHPHDVGVCVETVFVHESGECLSTGMLTVPAAKQDPQGYGSALTYARRYSLMAACGIAPEDDDGNAGSKRPEPKTDANPKPAPDMSPKARAQRIMVGVAAGDAAGAALALYEMGDEATRAIWQHLDDITADKLTAAWPKVDK
jgi:hypothetical protein